jgi:hypothetical protein
MSGICLHRHLAGRDDSFTITTDRGIVVTLQEKLDAFKADFKAGRPPCNAPPEIHPVIERATRELIASGLRTAKAAWDT